MADSRADEHRSADATLDHVLEEVNEIEGVGSKAKWFKLRRIRAAPPNGGL